ncbi:MAG: carbohydrate binding family 9 domain-containing protein [Bacteroidales bacterium]|nr:carbohydrate binding family 9 domain-containing protein [Candidatus Latescibacterota bacterium]
MRGLETKYKFSRFMLLTVFSILLSVISFFPSTAIAQDGEEYPPIYHPELTIRRSSGLIEIDGYIEDGGWKGAEKISSFFEHNPGDQTKPEVDTEVMITYDDTHLYVAWICYDDPDEVRAFFRDRDQVFDGDYVILCIDTYGDGTLAYEIAANPYGIPGDLLFSSNHGEDGSYNMIFESDGRITEFGWIVEMAIPFESLRFPDRPNQEWRMDFWRNRPRESRFQYSWAAYDRDENCWPCNWGTVRGISGVKSGSGLELLPSIVAYQSGNLNDQNYFDNHKGDGEISLGLSYDISSELTAEATINPDFSQIESDAAQIDVNSNFALYYQERRPFFQEGSDLFKTYYDAVYTRSINDPLLAGKVTWRKGSNSVAMLSAYDEHSIIMMPFEEGSRNVLNGKSYSNIIRAKHDFGKQAHFGLLGTDRRFDNGGSGSVVGIDGRIRLSTSSRLLFQCMTSYTEEVNDLALITRYDPDLGVVTDTTFNETLFADDKYTKGLDGETFWGHTWLVNLAHSPENYNIGADYMEMSPTFRADNGFVPSNNRRRAQLWFGAIKRFEESSILEATSGNVNLARVWNFDNVKKDEWVMATWELRFRAAQTGIHSRFLLSDELYREQQFNEIWLAHTCFNTTPSGLIQFGGNIDYGHRIARHELVMGKELTYGAWAEIRPLDRLYFFGSFNYVRSDDLDTDERLFSQSVFRSRIAYQFSRRFSARVIAQYNDRWDAFDIDPMLTYRVNAFSAFYLGSTHTYQDMVMDEHGIQGWYLRDRQFFLKFQYLFQI